MINLKNIGISIILSGMLIGCGSSSSTNNDETKGTLIDDFVSGVKYINGTNEGFTDSKGQFPYESGSVDFFVGDIKLGSIDSMTSDNQIFIQDIVGVSRDNTTNTDVLKIGRFLQSLDSDKTTDKIEIESTDFDKFEDTNNTKTNLVDSATDVDTVLTNAGIASSNIVSQAEAKKHIINILKLHGEISTDSILTFQSSTISSGDTDVSISSTFDIVFNDDIPKKYLNSDYFILKNSTGTIVNSDITFKDETVSIDPKSDLNTSENYTLTIKSSIKNYARTAVSLDGGNTDKVITFTTSSTTSSLILKIDTSKNSNDNNFTISTNASYSDYSFDVDCNNDGIKEKIGVTSEYICEYSTSSTFEVAISGTYPSLVFAGEYDAKQAAVITEVVQWGDNKWSSMEGMFYRAENLATINTNAGTPDLSKVVSLKQMFKNAKNFDANLSSWDISKVTTIEGMFNNAQKFNGDVSSWNTSSVINMSNVFNSNYIFDQNLSSWDTSSVTDMSHMFNNTKKFNGDVSSWNISSVTKMDSMFFSALLFNQDLSSWYSQKDTNVTTNFIFDNSGMTDTNKNSFINGPSLSN